MFSTLSSCILFCANNVVVRSLKLKHLAHKIFTVALVMFYYSIMEQVPRKKRLSQNDSVLLNFLAM